MTEIIPGYFVHTPDEKFGPYANIMEADTAAEKLMSEGVQVLGITKEGFEGVVSFEALEYSAESEAGGFRDGTGCISTGTFPSMVCEYCGFDPHDLVYYQCKQNDEDLTWDEWKEECEFYFYEGSHAENCKGLIEEMEEQEQQNMGAESTSGRIARLRKTYEPKAKGGKRKVPCW
ncbi:uncharacterized protein METZ01_LOCUS434186, partial [marine metagenome]